MSVGSSTSGTIKKWIRRDKNSPYTLHTDDQDDTQDAFGNIDTEQKELIAYTQVIGLNDLKKQGFTDGNLEEKKKFRQGWTFNHDLKLGDRLDYKEELYEILGIADHEFHVYFTAFLVK